MFDNLAGYKTRTYPNANLQAGPVQMTVHTLDAPKGWPSPHAVDFSAQLSSSVTLTPVPAGRCVHLENDGTVGQYYWHLGVRGGLYNSTAAAGSGASNATGTPGTGLETATTKAGGGVAAAAGQCDVAGFLFQNSTDPDVSNPGGNPASTVGGWVAVSPSGNMMALMAAGAYELQTTEYYQSAGTTGAYTGVAAPYAPGDGLTAVCDDVYGNGGLLCHGQAYKNALVGVVARGESQNSRGQYTNSFTIRAGR